ncbi:MAG: GIY-YIG nuclease family protein [Clostridiales bacterium]|nr:GIY-YIG nuclease family protein [Clostridiales bacterium]
MEQVHGKAWEVYMLCCADGSFYTGIARDAERRAEVHNSGKGAKYTRSRLPAVLIYREPCRDYSTALRREAAIKRLTHAAKQAMANEYAECHPSSSFS